MQAVARQGRHLGRGRDAGSPPRRISSMSARIDRPARGGERSRFGRRGSARSPHRARSSLASQLADLVQISKTEPFNPWPRDHDEVVSVSELLPMSSKILANETAEPITKDRVPHLAGNRDAKPAAPFRIGRDQDGESRSSPTRPAALDPAVLHRLPDSIPLGERSATAGRWIRAHGVPSRSRCGDAPWPGDARAPCGHSWCACGSGIRGCAFVGSCWAGRCAS